MIFAKLFGRHRPAGHEKLIVVDFDHALFNTEEFKESLREIFIRHGIDRELYEETYKRIRTVEKSPYSLERHLDILEGKIYDKQKLQQIKREVMLLLRATDKYLFPDTIDFLEKEKRDNKLMLLTLGELDFQSLKIRYAGIEKYFAKVIISRGRLGKGTKEREVAKIASNHRHQKIVIIEDVAENIDLIKKICPEVITIKVERPGAKYSHLPSVATNYVVSDLKAAAKIIDQL